VASIRKRLPLRKRKEMYMYVFKLRYDKAYRNGYGDLQIGMGKDVLEK